MFPFNESHKKCACHVELKTCILLSCVCFFVAHLNCIHVCFVQVFENVIRAALVYKRHKHFWNLLGNLKRIQHPLAQAPLLPSKPALPRMDAPPDTLNSDLRRLLEEQQCCDVTFLVGGVKVRAHRAVLACAHDVFRYMFTTLDVNNTNSSDQSAPSCCALRVGNGGAVAKDKNAHVVTSLARDKCALLDNEEIASSMSSISSMSCVSGHNASMTSQEDGHLENSSFKTHRQVLNHLAFTAIETAACARPRDSTTAAATAAVKTSSCDDVIVHVAAEITPTAFQKVLLFLYTCDFNPASVASDPDTMKAAALMGVTSFAQMLLNVVNGEAFLNKDLVLSQKRKRNARVLDLLVDKKLFSGKIGF